jgi:hypothetical protein
MFCNGSTVVNTSCDGYYQLVDTNFPLVTTHGASPVRGSRPGFYFTFASTDSASMVTLSRDTDVQLLVVGGGGGGGSIIGGGGGAGGVVYRTITLPKGTYNVTVGEGGLADRKVVETMGVGYYNTSSTNGQDSSIVGVGGLFVGMGGGAGDGHFSYPGHPSKQGSPGGSGGGGSMLYATTRTPGGAATQGATLEGTAGGHGGVQGITTISSPQAGVGAGSRGGGGGGGAGNRFNQPFDGSDGVSLNITGVSTYYAAGGGGGFDTYESLQDAPKGLGGSGVGGNGWGTTAYTSRHIGTPSTTKYKR